MTPPDAPAVPHLVVRPQWLALREEEALEPGLPIIDAHHHLWDHEGARYFLEDLLADTGAGHDIRATVAVECKALYRTDGPVALRPLGETEFLVDAAARSAGDGRCQVAAAIVGHADLCLGAAVRPVLEAQVRAGAGRLRGIRYSAVWHPDPAARGSLARPAPYVMADPAFRAGFAELAPLGLSFDAWVYHTQLPELASLARQFPGTTLVLNHVGGVLGIGPYAGHREAVRREWTASLRELADCSNVCVKLGGLGMRLFGFDFADRALPPGSQELAQAWRPYIETCIELFGPQRCMFESNFPVDKGCCSYVVLWNAFKRITAGASAADKQALYSGTAARVYRLAPPDA
ncbi:amidohydrolase family protein [Ramlibacter sp. MAHUQ-53]|uniref:amidohydrolase family protein n=1 Tax=unclassified Ramlibacter TaxID=2617605 RepID=UPI0036398CBB